MHLGLWEELKEKKINFFINKPLHSSKTHAEDYKAKDQKESGKQMTTCIFA